MFILIVASVSWGGSGGVEEGTDRVIGEQAGVVVEDEPPELPALHHVRPFAERALDGRHRRRPSRTSSSSQRNTPLERTFSLRAINFYKINLTKQQQQQQQQQ